jgi:signal transduction histidine kinase/CheY-like chemotaxis protein
MNTTWSAVRRWFVPDPALTLENQFFQWLCFLGGLLTICVAIPVNSFQNLSPWVNRIVLLFGLVSLALGWAARRGHYLKRTLLFSFVIGLDLLWFPNGGSYGSIPLYFFISTLYLVLFFQGAFRNVGIALAILNVLGLHAAELLWPRLAHPFATPLDRLMDLGSGYLVSLFTSALFLGVILNGFRAERESLKEASAARFETDVRMKAILECTADFIWSVDAGTFRLMTFNAALRDYFLNERGIRLWVGMSQEDLFPPGPFFDFWQANYRRALEEGAFTTEYLTYKKTNQLLLTLNPLERDGKVFGISVFGKDISERKRLEAERREFEAQLRQVEKMDSLGSLAGGVAHDMNNVLGAILGLASTHLHKAPKGSDLARDMETITRTCQRGGTLVKGLLGFARKSLAEERELELNGLVREAVALLERTTLQKIRLITDLAGNLRAVKGDPAALSHALMNLSVNAVDAMPEGGTLTLRTRNETDGTVVLEVEDSGCGMPKEVLDRALDPFFTTKPQGEGTGLGLSMVYATMKAHEGRLDLHSEPGAGTRITLTFPGHHAAQGEPSPEAEPIFKAPQAPLSVLLVDDDEFIREAVEAVLEALGHSTTIATGGEEALKRLEAGLMPDLVILDMNMPGLDGAGTLPRLRSLNPSVPVLLATGRVDRAVLALIEAHQGVTLLSKPFDIKELQQKLEGAV